MLYGLDQLATPLGLNGDANPSCSVHTIIEIMVALGYRSGE